MRLTALKELSLATNLYQPARSLYRLLNHKQLTRFRQELEFYSQLLKPESLCFDVGANIGEKAEILLKTGASVLAFEPLPQCQKELQVRCSYYYDRLKICQNALGAEPGEAELCVYPANAQSSMMENWQDKPHHKITVPVTTLDMAIARYGKPDYCKIDVEGYELNVLKGLSQAIPLISFEYHLGEREVQTARSCLDYLSQFGDIEINITPSTSMSFMFEKWVSLSEFLQLFPQYFVNLKEYAYGDIFVRYL
jgi:FkbM family methyltransferase